jgi:hypothetical protein
MVQQRQIWSDDRLIVVLDTFHDRRNGFGFEVNPNGLRGDALIENNQTLIHDWNPIWYAEARIDGAAWTAELQIPLASLSFDPEGDVWGINFLWDLPGAGEFTAWSSQGWQILFEAPSAAGELRGLAGLAQGVGLDLVPALALKRRKDFTTGRGELDWEPSLDVLYKLSNSATAALTFNPDFSSTEPDDRQVNLSRFSLFFPEKRTFFLQDAGIFEFGGLTADGRENGRPFFSRTVGLAPDGAPVDIVAGAKVTGREGPWSFGALAVRQDASATVDAATLAVARAVRNVGTGSSLGLIATSGDPQSNLGNTVLGVDYRYRDSHFNGDHTLEGELWWQGSRTEGPGGDGEAYGAALRYPNDVWNIEGRFKHIGEEFDPALGFVNRGGVRQFYGRARYRVRTPDGYFNAHNFIMVVDRTDGLDGGLQSQRAFAAPWAPWKAGVIYFELYGYQQREGVDAAFDLFDRLPIAAGDYRWTQSGAFFEINGGKPLSGWGSVERGDFYDGRSRHVDWNLTWRPAPRFSLNSRFAWDDVELPSGAYISRLFGVKPSIALTPKLAWVTIAQWDNVSRELGIDTRLRWTPRAGEEVAFVLAHGASGEPGDFRSTRQEAVARAAYTFRF